MERVILGVDPGFVCAGFSLLRMTSGSSVSVLSCGVFRMRSSDSIQTRLHMFHSFFSDMITQHAVSDLALETPFLGKNARNFLLLGYLRGVLLLLAEQNRTKVYDFSPREIKQAVSGRGSAGKDEVARVLFRLFPALAHPDKFDATDALAVALCAALVRR